MHWILEHGQIPVFSLFFQTSQCISTYQWLHVWDIEKIWPFFTISTAVIIFCLLHCPDLWTGLCSTQGILEATLNRAAGTRLVNTMLYSNFSLSPYRVLHDLVGCYLSDLAFSCFLIPSRCYSHSSLFAVPLAGKESSRCSPCYLGRASFYPQMPSLALNLCSNTLSLNFVVVVVQPLCCLFVTPWTAARQASLSFTISWSLLRLMSIESMMPSNHLILWCPLLLLPSIFPSIRVFSRLTGNI